MAYIETPCDCTHDYPKPVLPKLWRSPVVGEKAFWRKGLLAKRFFGEKVFWRKGGLAKRSVGEKGLAEKVFWRKGLLPC